MKSQHWIIFSLLILLLLGGLFITGRFLMRWGSESAQILPSLATMPEIEAAAPEPGTLHAPFDEGVARDLQQSWASHLETKIETTNSLGMKLTLIPPGGFVMGTPEMEPDRNADEGPQHKVLLEKPFLVATSPVTVGQFRQFAAAAQFKTQAETGNGANAWNGSEWKLTAGANWLNPGFEQSADHPVVSVSWNDADAFCRWLSEKEGKRYRLPTEAEWEFCCRAGTQGAYLWGGNPDAGRGWANLPDITFLGKFPGEEVFNWQDEYVFTSPVASFRANAFGLCDMVGNVWQWCGDWYAPYESGEQTDPAGPTSGNKRTLRGGSWYGTKNLCRCGTRYGFEPDARGSALGFRVVMELE